MILITVRGLVNFHLCCRVTLTSWIWPFLSIPKSTSWFRFFTQTLAVASSQDSIPNSSSRCRSDLAETGIQLYHLIPTSQQSTPSRPGPVLRPFSGIMSRLNFIFPYSDPAIPHKLLSSPEHTVHPRSSSYFFCNRTPDSQYLLIYQ